MPRLSVWRRALSIALPLMLAESIDSILWLVDTYFVSGLGEAAIEAVGLGGYMNWLLFSVGSMMYTGTLVLVAQALGAGERRLARRASGEALLLNALIAIPIAAASGAHARGMVALIAGSRVSARARMLAAHYFRLRLLGLPFLYAGLSLDATYRGAGVTRPVLWATLASSSLNALLDPMLIYGLLGLPSLGVGGAALASVIASIAYASLLAFQARGTLGFNPLPSPPTRLSLTMAKLGLPVLAERLAFVGGNLAYLGVVARCGDAALAAHTVGVRIESIAFLPLSSIGESAATIAGQEVGSGRVGEARIAGVEVAKLNVLAALAVSALLAGLSGILPRAFTENTSVERLARLYLLIAAASEPPYAVAVTLSMAVRGSGNTLVPTVINLASLYGLRVLPAGILASRLPQAICAAGAWTAMLVDQAGRALMGLAVYRSFYHKLARRIL